MNTVLWYVLPGLIILLSVAMKPLRAWLESCAKESASQAELVEEYQRNVAKFLRLTDPKKHAEIIDILVWTGQNMLKGTKLIRLMVLNGRRRSVTDAEVHREADDAFASLPDEALHAFSKAVGSALLVSSYQAIFLGKSYRAILSWLVRNPDKEIKEPEQIVYRYRKSHVPVIGRVAA
ncbi:hypothetical protein NKI78_04570 [Mesorhizobium sp. M0400]|uniref:hypothetical protein n=1 Tax=Mesorhizobium sp. M0400 TaxID=2956941 RepID=UPI003338E44F